jgi:membrane-bound lytic murein transglycosylase D
MSQVKIHKTCVVILLIVQFFVLFFGQVSAQGPATRHPEFRVHDRMRPRVDFWIDIFAKYDQNHTVIHHRDYPGVVFQVLDFTRQAGELTPVQLARYRDRVFKQEVSALKQILRRFATGAQPRNDVEKRIFQRMQNVPGGQRKFRVVVEQDLIRGQTGIRCKFEDALRRSGRYLPFIEQIFVNEFGLPIELTRLPFIESSFDYTAYSKTGAAGIWQFMPATARIYMKVGSIIDERRDPIVATRASAKYLRSGYRRFNSWPLAVTAYNHGAAGVARKVRVIGSSDIVQIVEHPTQRVLGFASNNFWAELLAAVEVYERRSHYFPEIAPEPVLRYTEIRLQSAISASVLSKRLGVGLDTLQKYNYAPTPPVWRGRYQLPAGFGLRLPIQYSARAKELGAATKVIAAEPVKASSVIYGGNQYRVRKGDTLIAIARHHGTTVAQLRALNGIRSDVIRVGQLLAVSKQRSSVAASYSASGFHRVAPGETLSAISRRYGVSVAQIKRQNNLKSDIIRVGHKLAIGGAVKGGGVRSIPRQYRVRSGDNLWKIAKQHGVSAAALKSKNGLRGDKIRPGQMLNIPSNG